MAMEFIGDLAESRLLPTYNHLHQYRGKDIAEFLYLYLCAIHILAHEAASDKFITDYARRTIHYGTNFDVKRTTATDLYVIIHAILSDDTEFKHQIASEFFIDHVSIDLESIVTFLRNVAQHSGNAANIRLLFSNLDRRLHINDSGLRAIRRLAMDWTRLDHEEKQLCMTRLLQLFRHKTAKSELLPWLDKVAREQKLELKDIDAATGEHAKKRNLLRDLNESADPLTELAVSRRGFEAVLNDPGFRIGFEAEMVLDYPSDEGAIDPDFLEWRELDQYFEDLPHERMDESYQEWLGQKLKDEWDDEKFEYTRTWLENNGHWPEENDYQDADDYDMACDDAIANNEDAAYEEWVNENEYHVRERYGHDDWIREQFGNIAQMIRYYGLEPIHGWTDDGQFRSAESVDNESKARSSVADQLREVLGVTVEVFASRHETEKNPDYWYIEPDESIEGFGNVNAEIVSQVYTLGDGLAKMQQLFRWMSEQGHETNASCGLHINLSIANKKHEDYDFLKMMLFYDERHTARLFGREEEGAAVLMQQRIRQLFPMGEVTLQNRAMPTLLDWLRVQSQTWGAAFGKHSSINPRGNGVFEFRNMGGRHYEKNFEQIRNRVVHMASILKLGADPAQQPQEYVRRVVQLVRGQRYHGDADRKASAEDSAVIRELPHWKPLFDSLGDVGTLMKQHFAGWPPLRFAESMLRSLQVGYIKKIDARQRWEFQQWARRHGITKQVLDRHMGHVENVPYAALGFPSDSTLEPGHEFRPRGFFGAPQPAFREEEEFDDIAETATAGGTGVAGVATTISGFNPKGHRGIYDKKTRRVPLIHR